VLPRLDALCDGLHNLSATLNPTAERAATAADAEAHNESSADASALVFEDEDDDMGGMRTDGASRGGPRSDSPLSAVARALGNSGASDSDGVLAAAVSSALRSMMEDAELTLLTATRSAVALVRAHGVEARLGDGSGLDDGANDGCCAWLCSVLRVGSGSGSSVNRSGSPGGSGGISGRGHSGGGGGPLSAAGSVRRRRPWVEQLRQLQVVAATRRAMARSTSARPPHAASAGAASNVVKPGAQPEVKSASALQEHAAGYRSSSGEDEAAALMARQPR
jgi:hypothetical protein